MNNVVDRMKRIPVVEQEASVRAKNFKEVCLGYDEERAFNEASRCLGCKNPKCVSGCPVSINSNVDPYGRYRFLKIPNGSLCLSGPRCWLL